MSRGAVVLMYHAIGGPEEPPSRFVVPVSRFERQLELVLRLGYRVVALGELVQELRAARVPRRSVAITLDDGYLDNRTLAYPVLERLGLPATIFAVSRGEHNDWEGTPPLRGRTLLAREHLREMAPFVTVGAHTRTHSALTALPLAAAEEEITGSRTDLEQSLGVPVTLFAYPYGMFDGDIRALVVQAGFLGACGVIGGRNDADSDLFNLRRLEIQGTFSLARFAATIELGDTRIRERWRARRPRSGPRTGGA